MPRRASIRALVPERLSVSECSKYAIHHIIVQNIPNVWLSRQQFVILLRQNIKQKNEKIQVYQK